jgi:predicted enzyme related to lactoylglutathione lyase
MLQELDFVMVYVPDLAQAINFYTEKLGFVVEDQMPEFVQFKRHASGGAIFALAKQGDGTSLKNVELWWHVDDADATFADLAAKDVQIVNQLADEPFGRTFSIKDPAGHTLYMFQPAQRPS